LTLRRLHDGQNLPLHSFSTRLGCVYGVVVAILRKSQGSAALAERLGAGAEFERFAAFGVIAAWFARMLQRQRLI
jgi:hypothetical protein